MIELVIELVNLIVMFLVENGLSVEQSRLVIQILNTIFNWFGIYPFWG